MSAYLAGAAPADAAAIRKLAAAIAAESLMPPVEAILVVGSHARGTARPDSDVDLVILTADPAGWLRDTAWAARLGPVDRTQAEDWGAVQSLRVWYAGGLEVEFGFASPSWLDVPLDPGARAVLEDGYHLLHDSTGWAASRLAESGVGST